MNEDLTQWTTAALRESLYEVDDERKALRRLIRKNGGHVTPQDEADIDAMNVWAQEVMNELMRRAAGSPRCPGALPSDSQ